MATPSEIPLDIYAGSVITHTYTFEKDGAPVILTGAVVTMTVRNAADGEVFSKVSTDSAQIDITGATTGQIALKFVTADTVNLEGTYEYDIWAVLQSGENSPMVAPSPFRVHKGATRPS